MTNLLSAWNAPSGSGELFGWIAGVLIVGFVLIFALMQVPPQLRRPIIVTVTFLCGLFYVLLWLFPAAQDHVPGDVPKNGGEALSFWLTDATGEVGGIATVLSSFLLGLGAISLLRIHLTKIIKGQKDAFFSFVTLGSMFAMIIVGYNAWLAEKFPSAANANLDFNVRDTWMKVPGGWSLWTRDFMFDGLLQKMDAAMFSIIAFYIISAAYRAFRIRSVESTILLGAALIMMLSLLPLAEGFSGDTINKMTNGNQSAFLQNFTLSEIAGFIRSAFQAPSIRGIDFGIGIGALAMGIRLWLSMDKQGMSS